MLREERNSWSESWHVSRQAVRAVEDPPDITGDEPESEYNFVEKCEDKAGVEDWHKNSGFVEMRSFLSNGCILFSPRMSIGMMQIP